MQCNLVKIVSHLTSCRLDSVSRYENIPHRIAQNYSVVASLYKSTLEVAKGTKEKPAPILSN